MKVGEPLSREWIPKLSQRLATGFSAAERGAADFYSPAILEWKYFAPRGGPDQPRSLILARDENIVTHIGSVFTAFHSTEPGFQPVPALHMIDWISSPDAGPGASVLLVNTRKQADVQYALGSTESARRVMLGFRYREVMRAPRFYSVLRPSNPAVWRELHGEQPFPRKVALRLLDTMQNLRQRNITGPLSMRPATSFGDELAPIFKGHSTRFLYSSRDPAILNHLLAHPGGIMRGWQFFEGSKLRGFAITSCFQKGSLRMGKIADWFFDTEAPGIWAQAASLLRSELRGQGADVVGCYGTIPWTETGLRQAGFFRRGGAMFYLRDPLKRLPEGLPFHLTDIEGDAAFQ